MTRQEIDRILGVYDALDDEEVSTERLLSMVADAAGVSFEDVMTAIEWRIDNGTDGPTTGTGENPARTGRA